MSVKYGEYVVPLVPGYLFLDKGHDIIKQPKLHTCELTRIHCVPKYILSGYKYIYRQIVQGKTNFSVINQK